MPVDPKASGGLERLKTVVTAALGDRIPGTAALSEMLRRRRATAGPAEQTFATLVGLELRPRKMREAAVLWERLTEAAGIDDRDAVWAHPDLLPSSADLDEPAGGQGGAVASQGRHQPRIHRLHQRCQCVVVWPAHVTGRAVSAGVGTRF